MHLNAAQNISGSHWQNIPSAHVLPVTAADVLCSIQLKHEADCSAVNQEIDTGLELSR
jgi:hypothetical protein